MKQMTDDDIDMIKLDVYGWFERHPLWATDEGYDWFSDMMDSLLGDFSNGYKNYN